MSRLYVVEGRFSITGGMADHRLRMPSSAIGAVANLLGSKLVGDFASNSFAAFSEPNVNTWLTECAKDLQNAKGRANVLCGSQQPPEVQAIVQQINDALGAKGTIYSERFVPKVDASTISDLAAQITSGAIKTLFILGGNPVFNAPAELNFPTCSRRCRRSFASVSTLTRRARWRRRICPPRISSNTGATR